MKQNMLLIIARVLIPSVFIALGVERIAVHLGIIAGPEFTTGAIIFSVLELVLGLMIALGWKLRYAAGSLAVFIIIDAVASHPFWVAPPNEFHEQYLHFAKNLSSLGGLILLIWLDLCSVDMPKTNALE